MAGDAVKKFAIDAREPEEEIVLLAAAALARGDVIAGPTDTLYGLFADPRSARAIDHVYEIKGRPAFQPLPLVAANREQVETLAGPLSGPAARLAEHFWPGPLSLLVSAWKGLDERVHGGTGAVAVRVPRHAAPRALAAVLHHPLVATSANFSGLAAPDTASGIDPKLAGQVALVLDAGPTPGGLASTIVDVRGSEPVLIRSGAVPWSRVLESLQ